MSVSPPKGCCVGTKGGPSSVTRLLVLRRKHRSEPPLLPGASIPSNLIPAPRSPRTSRPRSCGSHLRAPPAPAAPRAQEGARRPAAPVTFEPGALGPSDPGSSPIPSRPPAPRPGSAEGPERKRRRGPLTILPRAPRSPQLAGPSLPLRSSPSRSFLFPGSLDTRPGRGAGEAHRGGGDRSRGPNYNSRRAPSAREPAGPGLAPLSPPAPPQTPTP